jgi:Fe-Mn family superoxide dismutase
MLAAAVDCAAGGCFVSHQEAAMAFTLPPLPYPTNALEPNIDATTMEIHHGRHHKTYVDNLNKALEGHTDLQNMRIEELMRQISRVPENIRTAVRNNGGGHANHTMFWEIMAKGGGEPSGPLGDEIKKAFGDLGGFKQKMKEAALGRFGSGWAWLVLADGQLKILSTANQDSPYMDGQTPVMGIDVWEHAYYLKYQNKRADYVDAWWNVVNWPAVAKRFSEGRAGK